MLESGEFLIVKANENHKLKEQSRDFVKFVWGFNIEDAESRYKSALSLSEGKYKATDIMHRSLELLLMGLDGVKNNRLYVLTSALSTFFFEMCAVISPGDKDLCNAVISYKDKSEYLVKQIETYITDNISNSIRAADIAAEFSFSERQLSRIFVKYFGKTVTQYLHDERIALAERLLCRNDLTLDEIAVKVGYNDAFSFGKAFKKHTGTSPGVFRRTLSKK